MSRISTFDRLSEGIPTLVLSFVYALPFPLVALVLGMHVSPVDHPSEAFLRIFLIVAAGGFLVGFAAYQLLFRIANPFAFAVAGSVSVLAIIGLTALAGARLHRDFFSAVFMDLPVALCLLLSWSRARPAGTIKPEHLKAMGGVGQTIFGVFAVWILMMGYAISTRAEPRPMESIIYNAYNAILALLLLLLARGVLLKSRRTLSVSSAGVFLDGAPIEAVLGSTEIAILRAFLRSPERRLACSDVQRLAGERQQGRGANRDCSSCDPQKSKAADCPGYRGTYNRILVIKRLLEFLEIGTILPPKNKLQILADGWSFRAFENVRIRIEE